MKDYIEKRAVELAQYIVENNATVRKTAKIFNISKSTVHKDVHERLYKINPALYKEAQAVLEQNVTFVGVWQQRKNICLKN